MKQEALKYIKNGLSVLPNKMPGSKNPDLKEWKSYQSKIASIEQVSKWFVKEKGISIVCGEVSGNLEVIDLESYKYGDGDLFQELSELIELDHPSLLNQLVIQKSASNGHHLIYRCNQIQGAQILARKADNELLIETRGEGSLIIAAPTKGYELIQNNFENIPEITPAQRTYLLETASSFNGLIKEEPRHIPPPALTSDNSPGNEYNHSGDFKNILKDSGWRFVYSRGHIEYWRRPGKKEGISATWNFTPGKFHVFSSNALPFEIGCYSPFAVYTFLKHSGDFKQAAQDLKNKGFGKITSNKAPDSKSVNAEFTQVEPAINYYDDLIEPYTLEQLIDEIKRTPDGLSTGYKNLDEIIAIPQEAITIIAGRPSHGKTTFMMNLALNMVQEDPEKTVVFFSYEETRKQIGLKFLNILSKKEIDTKKNIDALETYIKLDKDNNTRIETGKELFKTITKNNNLKIIDTPFNVDQLCQAIEYLKDNTNLCAVFIDYIQKIRARGDHGNRTVELEYISNRLLETAKSLSIPIILGAQLGRDKDHKDKVQLDNLRSSGDIEQDANLVIGLYNPAMQKALDEGVELTASTVDLRITILKNRNGTVNEERKLKFNRPILNIELEKSPFES